MGDTNERKRNPDEIIPTRPPPPPPLIPVKTPIDIPPDQQWPEEEDAPTPPPTKPKPPRHAPSQRGIRKSTPPEHTAIVIKDRARPPFDSELTSCALLSWR